MMRGVRNWMWIFAGLMLYLQADFTHGFVLEFASEEDLKYYLEEDAVHLDFKKFCKPLVEKAAVVDYTPGVF